MTSSRRRGGCNADLVVLDVMLPGMDGMLVCQALRGDAATAAIPIIMLTARGEEADRVRGLELGADDYVTKPFSPKELVARVAALLRRIAAAGRHSEDAAVRPADASTSIAIRCCSASDEIRLTAKEFLLLQYFIEHPGRVLSRDLLLTDVWGYQYTGGTRTVDVHVRRLREKIPLLRHRAHDRQAVRLQARGRAATSVTFRTRTFLSIFVAASLALVVSTLLDRSVAAPLHVRRHRNRPAQPGAAGRGVPRRARRSSRDADAEADRLGRLGRVRVTLIAADGAVLGDSEVAAADLRTLENHAQREEIVEAATAGEGTASRRSHTTDVETMYAAVAVSAAARWRSCASRCR